MHPVDPVVVLLSHAIAWCVFALVVGVTRFAWGTDPRAVAVEGRVREVTPRPLELRRAFARQGDRLLLVAETTRADRIVIAPTHAPGTLVTIPLEGARVLLGVPLPPRHGVDEQTLVSVAAVDVGDRVRVLAVVLERQASATYRVAHEDAPELKVSSPIVIETLEGSALVERWHRALRRAHVICAGLLLALSFGDLWLRVGGLEVAFGSVMLCWLGVGVTWGAFRPWWLAPAP